MIRIVTNLSKHRITNISAINNTVYMHLPNLPNEPFGHCGGSAVMRLELVFPDQSVKIPTILLCVTVYSEISY